MGGLFSSEEEIIRPTQRSSNYSYPTTYVRSSYSSSSPPTNDASNNVHFNTRQINSSPSRNLNSSSSQTQQSINTTALRRSNYYSEDQIQDLTRRVRELSFGDDNAAAMYSAGGSRRRTKAPERSTLNYQLFGISNNGSVVTYTPLAEYDDEYIEIKGMITNRRRFKVDGIIKISNPYLEKAYELKKAQKQQQYADVEERLLFHGTKHTIVDNIVKKNFDWRCCKTHKFGKGVSFSPNAMYASNYSDKNVRNKIMIVAKVLIGESCIGNASMILPDRGCDTSQKGVDGIVIVKYEDNEFYPAYKILYHLENDGGANRNRRPVARQQPIFLNYDSDDYMSFYFD